jgi:uncharacterized protein (TIGR02117 family)
MTRFLKYFLKALLTLIGAIALYFTAAWLCSRIGVPAERPERSEVVIYIKTNGVHTDLVVPVRTVERDWSTLIPFSNTKDKDTSSTYVGIGWGDRGFYLETPTWNDLRASTAFKAAFGLSRSAIHTTFYNRMVENEQCVRIDISREQYARLVRYIYGTFETDSAGLPRLISTDAVYGGADAFYEAKGRYNVFRTCNTWTNSGLKAAGQKAAIWAPFDWGIFYQYRHSAEHI